MLSIALQAAFHHGIRAIVFLIQVSLVVIALGWLGLLSALWLGLRLLRDAFIGQCKALDAPLHWLTLPPLLQSLSVFILVN